MPVGAYDHLEPVRLELDLNELAWTLIRANYGVHRFLSALIRAEEQTSPERANRRLVQTIKALLEEGES